MVRGIPRLQNLPENISLSGSRMKKESPILGKIVRKRLFVPFEILALDVLTKNDNKLNKSFRKPLQGTFFENSIGFCDIRF